MMVVWIAVARVWAAEPADVVAYWDQAMELERAYEAETVQVRDAQLPTEPEQFEPFRLSLRKVLVDTRGAFAALPPFEGDTALRDAYVAMVDDTLGIVDRDAVQLLDDINASLASPRDTDVVTLDHDYATLYAHIHASEAAMRNATAAFAARHDLQLTAAREPTLDAGLPTLTTPALHPPLPNIPESVYAGLTMRYHNARIHRLNGTLDAVNGMFASWKSDPTNAVQAVHTAQSAVDAYAKAARTAEAWQGDASLVDAERTFATTLGDLLHDHALPIAKHKGEPLPDQAALDEYNAHVHALNDGYAAGLATLKASLAAFREHWALADYDAWRVAFNAEVEARRVRATAVSTASTEPAPAPAPTSGPTP